MYCFKSKSLLTVFSATVEWKIILMIALWDYQQKHKHSSLSIFLPSIGTRPCSARLCSACCSFLTSLLHLGCEDIDKHYRCHKWLYVSWGMTRWLVLHLLLSLPVPLYVCLMALHWCGSNFWSEETKEIWHPHSGHLLTQLPFSFLLSSEVLAFSRFLSLNHQISVKWHLRLLW